MKAMPKLRRFALLWVCTAAFCAAPPLVIRNARVFDGTRTLPRASVVVVDGRIAAIGELVESPAGAREIDGTGKTLLPGLIDAHVHVVALDNLRQALALGVTTELDMFTTVTMAADVRRQQAEGKLLDAADLFSSGTLATASGGHGTEYGFKIPTINGPEEAQAFVDARIAEGSDYIKIIYDDLRAYGGHTPTISRETLSALIAAAHKRHKLAIVHIGDLESARQAVEAGADGLAHVFIDRRPDAGFAKFVADHHAFVIPTLSVLRSACGVSNASLAQDARIAPYVVPADLGNLAITFPRKTGLEQACAQSEAVRQLKAAHVPLLAGTDPPNFGTAHGASLHGELQLLVEAGLTPEEALAAATSAPAAAFRLDDRGRIATGKRADLVLVNGDPTRDILATRDIVAVWKLGVEVDRGARRALVAQQNAEAGKLRSAPPPQGSESGLISDFEEEKPAAKFGAGWMASTDAMRGGKSTVEFRVVQEGAQNGRGSLLVTGEIRPGFAYPWAGVMFSPGLGPMAPANLSRWKQITFWARGDGREYRIMVFARRLGYQPAMQAFTAGPEWRRFSFPFSKFGGTDGSDIMSIIIAAGPPEGPFSLKLDDLRLE